MRILLVEDDDRIAQPLAEDLRHQHHVIDLAANGLDGWDLAQSVAYDLILLDIMLPKIDGISLCQKLRSAGYRKYVMMLTARDRTSDKVVGLDAGADDYLVKPFELEELSARIRALSRRPGSLQDEILRYDKLEMNLALHQVIYDQTLLNLTPKEYLILECLLRHPNQVFTRTMLLDQHWELKQITGENTIRTHITNLRQKLKLAGAQDTLIVTIYGVGYCLQRR